MPCLDTTSPEARFRQTLSQHRLHTSRQRLGLYEQLLAAEKPLTVDDLHWLTLTHEIVSTQTIHRTLKILVDSGFVREIRILKFGSNKQIEAETPPKCPCCGSSMITFAQHAHRWSCEQCYARGKVERRFAALKQSRAEAATEDAKIEKTEQRPAVWLHFQQVGHNFMVTRTAAYGSGAAGTAIPLGGTWDEVSTKLEQAGFSTNGIGVLKERLEDHAVAIVGPVSMTVEQLAVLGIQQAG
jgi:Fe2+ or Zn2+ uptake regulation protein